MLLHGRDEEAEKQLRWWLNIFGDDYYIELQRHRGLENIDGLGVSQEDVNQKLLALARKYQSRLGRAGIEPDLSNADPLARQLWDLVAEARAADSDAETALRELCRDVRSDA